MGQTAPGSMDLATKRSVGTLINVGDVTPWVPLRDQFWMAANNSPSGSGGQVALEFSFDGGATPLVASLPSGAAGTFNVPVLLAPTAPSENGVVGRLRLTQAPASGTVAARLSQ